MDEELLSVFHTWSNVIMKRIQCRERCNAIFRFLVRSVGMRCAVALLTIPEGGDESHKHFIGSWGVMVNYSKNRWPPSRFSYLSKISDSHFWLQLLNITWLKFSCQVKSQRWPRSEIHFFRNKYFVIVIRDVRWDFKLIYLFEAVVLQLFSLRRLWKSFLDLRRTSNKMVK